PESDVLNHSPGHGPAFVAHGEEHRKSVLAMGPVVLHEIAFHQHPAGVLKLEDILHRPGCASVITVLLTPAQWFVEMVSPHLDVCRHHLIDGRLGTAKHHVLSGPLQIVIDDCERTWSVPAGYCLG